MTRVSGVKCSTRIQQEWNWFSPIPIPNMPRRKTVILGRRQWPVAVARPRAKHPLPEVNKLPLAWHNGLKEKMLVLPKKLHRILVERVHSAAPPTLLVLSDHVLAPRTVKSRTTMLKSLTIHLLQGLIFLPLLTPSLNSFYQGKVRTMPRDNDRR